MLNVWISSLSDTDNDEGENTSNTEDVPLSPIPLESWENYLEEPNDFDTGFGDGKPKSEHPFTGFQSESLLRNTESPLPVVSTEAGSSSEFSTREEDMPSARFFYSNPPPTVPSLRDSSQKDSMDAHSSSNSRRGHHPQIHVQVNLPATQGPLAAPVLQHQNYAPAGISTLPAHQLQPSVQGGVAQGGTLGPNFEPVAQQTSVPMLFHGSNSNSLAYTDSRAAQAASSSGHGDDQFYSSFRPEVDFLEFQSMYYHLCEFYYVYGHANAPKHGDHFVLGSWVETLRQRKHIQDLKVSGISVAASTAPLSKRQIDLLESLGFRWHISPSENTMIIDHMKMVDRTSNTVQERSQTATQVLSQGDLFVSNMLNKPPGILQPQIQQVRSAQPNIILTDNLQVGGMQPGMLVHSNPRVIPPGLASQHVVQMPMHMKVEQEQKLVPTKPEKPKVVDKTDKIYIARQEQHEENIKACEGIIAKHQQEDNMDKNRTTNEIDGVGTKILIDPNLDTAEHLWKCMYAKLANYKRINGDCHVPARHNEDPKLGHWVMTQRRQFNLMKKNKPSSMTVERIKLLNDLDFSWSIRIDPEKMWNLRYEQLQEYKKKRGDCLVPQRFAGNPKLGTWVNTQRRHYKLMKAGRPSCMNQERLELLESIGFAWATGNSGNSSNGSKLDSEKPVTQGVEEAEATKKEVDQKKATNEDTMKRKSGLTAVSEGVKKYSVDAAEVESTSSEGFSTLSKAASIIKSMQESV